jgi:putative ABC transport system permease protein
LNYRVSIEIWVFMLSGLIALLLALITISTKSLKVAITNPSASLRSE